MTKFYEQLVDELSEVGISVEKAATMSRSEAGRFAANARWGKRSGGKKAAPKMVAGGWRSAAGIGTGEQAANARSKSGMQGARTRAQGSAAKKRAEAGKEAAKKRWGPRADGKIRTMTDGTMPDGTRVKGYAPDAMPDKAFQPSKKMERAKAARAAAGARFGGKKAAPFKRKIP